MKVMRPCGVVGGDAGEGVDGVGVDGGLSAFGDLEAAFDEEFVLVEGVNPTFAVRFKNRQISPI